MHDVYVHAMRDVYVHACTFMLGGVCICMLHDLCLSCRRYIFRSWHTHACTTLALYRDDEVGYPREHSVWALVMSHHASYHWWGICSSHQGAEVKQTVASVLSVLSDRTRSMFAPKGVRTTLASMAAWEAELAIEDRRAPPPIEDRGGGGGTELRPL